MDIRFFILDYLYMRMVKEYVICYNITQHHIKNNCGGCKSNYHKFCFIKDFYNKYVNLYYYSPHIKLPRRHKCSLLWV